MSESHSGGCLCGAVRYEVAGPPAMSAVCHCRNCQKQVGSAWSMLIGVPADALTVTGEVKTYVDHGDSGGEVHRQFCPTCGSPLFSRIPAMAQMIFVKAGTLDDTSGFQPAAQVYMKSKQAWVDLPGIPSFETMPG